MGLGRGTHIARRNASVWIRDGAIVALMSGEARVDQMSPTASSPLIFVASSENEIPAWRAFLRWVEPSITRTASLPHAPTVCV